MLLRRPDSVQHAAIAHEMAHERQQFCLKRAALRSVFKLEWEAEIEAREYVMAHCSGKPAGAGLIPSALRATLAAAWAHLSASPALGSVLVVLLVSGVAYVRYALPPFHSSPAVGLAYDLLFSCAVFLLFYKFLSGVRLSYWYARGDVNEDS